MSSTTYKDKPPPSIHVWRWLIFICCI